MWWTLGTLLCLLVFAQAAIDLGKWGVCGRGVPLWSGRARPWSGRGRVTGWLGRVLGAALVSAGIAGYVAYGAWAVYSLWIAIRPEGST